MSLSDCIKKQNSGKVKVFSVAEILELQSAANKYIADGSSREDSERMAVQDALDFVIKERDQLNEIIAAELGIDIEEVDQAKTNEGERGIPEEAREESGTPSQTQPEAHGVSLPKNEAISEKVKVLQVTYDEAKSRLDAIGSEPHKPSSERLAFGTGGRANADPAIVAKYDAEVKAHNAWRAKYSKLKKAEVEASNNLFRAKNEAASSGTPEAERKASFPSDQDVAENIGREVAAPQPKEPWQMTQKEYAASIDSEVTGEVREKHVDAIKKAHAEGKAIPDSVLKSYPVLRDKFAPQSKQELNEKPATGKYTQPANVSDRAGQIGLAERAARLANLKLMNDEVGAYSDAEIQNVATDNIDAVQEYLRKEWNKSKEPSQEPKAEQAIDNAVVNIPLAKRGDIDAQLDKYKREQAALAKSKAKESAQQTRESKALAKTLLGEYRDAILAKHGDKFGKKELSDQLDQWAKWEPKKLIDFVEKFRSEQASGEDVKFSQSKSKAANPHTLSTLTAAIDKAMGQGFARLLELTGKFKIIASADIGKYLGEGARFSKAQAMRTVDVFGNGSRIDHYDDKKGLMFSAQKMLSGTKWTVFETFPESEGGDQVLGEMFKYKSLDEAMDAVRGLRISATQKAKNAGKYGAIPSLWSGEAKNIAKALIDAGVSIDKFASSTQSKSKYIYLDSGAKIRLADHALPGAYDAADIEYRYGGDIGALVDKAKEANKVEDESVAQDQTETPAFRKWFGNSKVVDAEGRPLVVYHGTDQDITNFDKEKLGFNTNAQSAKGGFYFTNNARAAARYPVYDKELLLQYGGMITKRPKRPQELVKLEEEKILTEKELNRQIKIEQEKYEKEKSEIISALPQDIAHSVKVGLNYGYTKDADVENVRAKLQQFTSKIDNLRQQIRELDAEFRKHPVMRRYVDDVNNAKQFTEENNIISKGERARKQVQNILEAASDIPSVTNAEYYAFENALKREIQFESGNAELVALYNQAQEFTPAIKESSDWSNIYEFSKQSWEGGNEDDQWDAKKETLNPNIMPVYLALKNPLVHEQETAYRDKKYADLVEGAKAGGHDGLIIRNTRDPLFMDVYVAFEPEQIKSAIGNSGAFDPSNPDIRYSADGSRILAFVRNGETFLVADNISSTDDNVKGLLLHEIGVHALELGKTSPEFQAILKQLEVLRKLGNKKVVAAFEAAKVSAEEYVKARIGGTEPAAFSVAQDQTDTPDNDGRVVNVSLSKESARDVRIARIIAGQQNAPAKARLQGFYDYMLGNKSLESEQSKMLAVSYAQGWINGKEKREFLNSRNMKWTEVDKKRNNGKWQWNLYEEGLHIASGEAASETKADQSIDLAQASLRDKNDATNQDIRYSADGSPISESDLSAEYAKKREEIMATEGYKDALRNEAAGYLVQQNPDLSITQKLIAWFKAQIRKIGKTLPVLQRMQWFRAIDKMSVEDIVYAAEQALKSAPQTLAKAQDRGTFKAEMFSKSRAQQATPGTAQPPAQPPRQSNLPLQGGQPGNRASWDSPEPSFLDDMVYRLQDKNIDLKRVVQAIKDAGQQIAEKFNPYLQEELFHGRAAKRVQDFVNTELKPLMVEMKMRGLKLEEIDEYLHARHAKEANALIAKRDPNMPDGGSGMTDQQADDYFANLPADKLKKLEAAAKRVDAIITRTREMYVSYDLISRDQADEWAQMFQHYVPLMREDHDGGMGIGQGFSIKGKEVKHRTGSTAAVVDIFANIALQREKAIVRGEKNRVAVSLLGLAKLNPNPDFWTFDKVPTERVLNEKTGLVEERADPMFKSRPNVVVGKIKDKSGNIQERAVIFNEHDERAVRMAEAMKNLDATQLGGVLAASAKITRYFSSINTQYNPIFGVTNLVRDVQGAALNLSSTPLAGKQKEVLGHILSAAKGIYLDARAERKGAPATSKWAGLWEELQDSGGMTGYRDLYRTSADRAKAIEHELDPHNWVNSKLGQVFTAGGMLKVPLTKAQDIASPLFDWLSDYNLMMEGATRLSIYKTAIDHGMTKQAAASLAKNTTVNFNRKGQSGQQAGALYAFFNAAMQGTARIGQTVFDMDKGDIRTLRLSKTGQRIVYGGVLLGVMQALALAAAGFDDDDPPEFIRERNLIIPIGGEKYVSIPMPLGFHVLPNVGRISTEFALGGFRKPAEHVLRLVSVFAEAFNPIGSAGVSMQTIAPTALDPFAALAENKDWTGKPIYKEDFNSMKPTPGFTRNKDTASVWSKFIAEGINYATGGTDYTPGAFSPTADQIDYLIGQITGGVGRETSKVFQSGEALMTGESLPTHKIPLVGRFYGDSESQSSQGNKFYSNLKEINLIEMELKGRREDRLPTDEFRKENPKAQLIARAKYADNIISKLRKQKRELIEKNADRDKVRQVEERITAEMLRFNTAVDKFEARTP